MPTKQHMREVLIFCFHLKKSAAESHRLLVEAYGEHALSETTCKEWFRRFKTGVFDVDDKERPGQPKKFADEELEALLDQDQSLTLRVLAQSLNVDESTVSKRLQSLGYKRKQGNWVPHLLQEKDVERRLMTCEILLQRHKRKGFLHRIITGDEKWIYFDNPKRKKLWTKTGKPLPSTSTSTPKRDIHGSKVMLCIWWDQKGVVYYELLKPGEVVTGERYREQLLSLSRALKEKRPEYAKRHDKVILLHDNARPHVAKSVKEILEALGWDVLPHPPYSPDIAPSDYHLFRSMANSLAEEHFQSYEDVKKWVDKWITSKNESFFRDGIRALPHKWEMVLANSGQYFE